MSLNKERKSDREASGKAGEQNGEPVPVQFALAFGPDGLMDERRVRPALGRDLADLLSRETFHLGGRVERCGFGIVVHGITFPSSSKTDKIPANLSVPTSRVDVARVVLRNVRVQS